jgi:hypothetical protein
MVLMATTIVNPPVVKAQALACPNCGGPVELRGFAHTLSAVCPQCLSVIDTSTPAFKILQTFQGSQRIEPKIPLGSRGKWEGAQWEVIGYQVRQVAVDGDAFCWDEYLLFNPYKGFRYLSEYQGHWNWIKVLSALPEQTMARGKRAMRLDGRNYLHFDAMNAGAIYVLGEFPWQVLVGDVAEANDYISPPYMLSSESTEGEVTWSLAEYTSGDRLFQAFKVQGSAPRPVGVFANQPSPYSGGAGSAWRVWLLLMAVWLVLFIGFSAGLGNHEVFRQEYSANYDAGGPPASFVTDPFELKGRTSNVELSIFTDLNNNWIFYDLALINDQTGQAFDFGREVSYYTDSDGNEGSRNDNVVIPSVPSGRYYLRVEPEINRGNLSPVRYRIVLKRDVPNQSFFWVAALLLLIPPILITVRAASFEAARWRESDYAPSTTGGGD